MTRSTGLTNLIIKHIPSGTINTSGYLSHIDFVAAEMDPGSPPFEGSDSRIPGDSRFQAISRTNIAILCVESIAVVIRTYARIFIIKKLGWADGERHIYPWGSCVTILTGSPSALVGLSYMLSVVLLVLVIQRPSPTRGTAYTSR